MSKLSEKRKFSPFNWVLFVFVIISSYKILVLLHLTIFPTINSITIPTILRGSFTTNSFTEDIILMILSSFIFFKILERPKLTFFLITLGIIFYIFSVEDKTLSFVPALISICFSIASVICVVFRKNRLVMNYRSIVSTFFKGMIIFESFALVRWVLYPTFHTGVYSGTDWQISLIESNFFYFFALFAPILLILLIYSFTIRLNLPVLRSVIVNIGTPSFLNRLFHTKSIFNSENNTKNFNTTRVFSNYKLYLACILVASSLLPIIPYIPSLNPTSRPISVDIPYYVSWVDDFEKNGSSALFRVGTSPGENPLSLLIIHAIHSLTNVNLQVVLEFLPSILSPIFCFGIYLLVKEGTGDKKIAIITSALSVTSYTIMVGIYAGFFANWIAIIVGCFIFLFLIRFVRHSRTSELIPLAILLISIFFVHRFAGYFYIISIITFLIFSFLVKPSISKQNIILLVIIITVALTINYGVMHIFEASATNEANLLLNTTISKENFIGRWETLSYLTKVQYGGILANSLMISFAILWVSTVNFKDRFELLCFSQIPLVAFLFLFGDITLQSRLLYMLPVMLYASLGIFRIIKFFNLSKNYQLLLVLLVVLINSNYLLRSLMNWYLILPN